MYFVYNEEQLEGIKEIIERHYHFDNGKLNSAKHYNQTPDGKDTHLTLERHFEYH